MFKKKTSWQKVMDIPGFKALYNHKSFKKCVFYRKTKTLCNPPHVHGHIPQIISFLLNVLVARAPVVV